MNSAVGLEAERIVDHPYRGQQGRILKRGMNYGKVEERSS
jgi:hypothetical protein